GGSAISGYRITPWIGTAAQTPIVTNRSTTSATISGLTDGTTYTFTVAAVNGAGTGPDSDPSVAVTPASSASPYTNVVFSDGFESGDLSAWDSPAGTTGTGTVGVSGAGANAGSYGLRITDTAGQYGVVLKKLASPLEDSS